MFELPGRFPAAGASPGLVAVVRFFQRADGGRFDSEV